MGGKSLLRVRVKFAGSSVALDGGVELLRLEDLEPRAKPSQLARCKLFDGLFDFFGGGHG